MCYIARESEMDRDFVITTCRCVNWTCNMYKRFIRNVSANSHSELFSRIRFLSFILRFVPTTARQLHFPRAFVFTHLVSSITSLLLPGSSCSLHRTNTAFCIGARPTSQCACAYDKRLFRVTIHKYSPDHSALNTRRHRTERT